jgi:hypothetical protein
VGALWEAIDRPDQEAVPNWEIYADKSINRVQRTDAQLVYTLKQTFQLITSNLSHTPPSRHGEF